MLKESENINQADGEPFRRWFTDDFFDLIVWYDEEKNIIGFQLCYDVSRFERALTWNKDRGYRHEAIDHGEDNIKLSKMTPILVRDGIFDANNISEKFKSESAGIDPGLASFVLDKVRSFELG